jgi:hypothetical protein
MALFFWGEQKKGKGRRKKTKSANAEKDCIAHAHRDLSHCSSLAMQTFSSEPKRMYVLNPSEARFEEHT